METAQGGRASVGAGTGSEGIGGPLVRSDGTSPEGCCGSPPDVGLHLVVCFVYLLPSHGAFTSLAALLLLEIARLFLVVAPCQTREFTRG